jgi:hypothetical protein
LKVIDSQGTEGILPVNIPIRTLSVEPGESGPDSPITIRGSGYPVFNPNGQPVSVDIAYDGEDTGCTFETTSVMPDATGSFSGEIILPSCVTTPSTNLVIAEIIVGGAGTGVVEIATHHVSGSVNFDVEKIVRQFLPAFHFSNSEEYLPASFYFDDGLDINNDVEATI